jgi:hypothetical protein
MSAGGQNRPLPHCNMAVCFTSINRHKRERNLPVPMTSEAFSRYAAATLAPSKGLPTVPNSLPIVTWETA